jgi:hypothetical protein
MWYLPIPYLFCVLAWFFLAFAFSIIYIYVAKRLFVLHLELFHERGKDEFQKLRLGK